MDAPLLRRLLRVSLCPLVGACLAACPAEPLTLDDHAVGQAFMGTCGPAAGLPPLVFPELERMDLWKRHATSDEKVSTPDARSIRFTFVHLEVAPGQTQDLSVFRRIAFGVQAQRPFGTSTVKVAEQVDIPPGTMALDLPLTHADVEPVVRAGNGRVSIVSDVDMARCSDLERTLNLTVHWVVEANPDPVARRLTP